MNTNSTEETEDKKLDTRTDLEDILSGRWTPIHVTGWDEAMELEAKEPLILLRIEDFQKYWDNKYFCTTTTDGLLP